MYPLDSVRSGEADGAPVRAAYIHRLPSKISSIAWDPFDEVSLIVPALSCEARDLVCTGFQSPGLGGTQEEDVLPV